MASYDRLDPAVDPVGSAGGGLARTLEDAYSEMLARILAKEAVPRIMISKDFGGRNRHGGN